MTEKEIESLLAEILKWVKGQRARLGVERRRDSGNFEYTYSEGFDDGFVIGLQAALDDLEEMGLQVVLDEIIADEEDEHESDV